MKGRIECALFHAKYMVRSALDELRDAVAMHCALSQCFEHQHVERALNQVARFVSDLFHAEVPLPYIRDVFDIMRRAHWHQYQVLTKRSERLMDLSKKLKWEPQIWMGVSVENQDYTMRIDDLRRTDAHVKFLSLEPLLGPLRKLNLRGIDWVIVGGESGPGARPMDSEWVHDIRDQCLHADVQFFFKQWGGVNKKKAGRALDGRTWDQMPDPLVVL